MRKAGRDGKNSDDLQHFPFYGWLSADLKTGLPYATG
jgi:hypothetical protein